MEAIAAQIQAIQIVETGSLALAVATERARRYMAACQEALKAIAHRASPPESYIQMASTAVAVGDPEAAQSAAQRLLDLTPRLLATQRRFMCQSAPSTTTANRQRRPTRFPVQYRLPQTGSPGRASV
jgi:hypothetical protein